MLASVDSIYQNPSTRHLILRLFKENPDNTVDVVWRGWDDWCGRVFSVISEDFALKDIQKQFEKEKWNNSRKLSKTCEAFRAIEILNAQSAILQSKQAAKTRADYSRPEYGIIKRHTYSVEPIDNEQGRMFVVRNSHNANNEMIFDYDTLEKCFTNMTIASDFI